MVNHIRDALGTVSETLLGFYDGESGFEKVTKFTLSILKPLNGNGFFEGWINHLNPVKEIFYGTKMFFSLPLGFISITNTKDKEKVYGLKMPRKKKDPAQDRVESGPIDYVRFFYAVGDICCFGKLLQTNGVNSFSWFSKQAATIGSKKLFSMECKDIPVFNNLLDKPKDFFMVLAAGFAIKDCLLTKVEVEVQGEKNIQEKVEKYLYQVPLHKWNLEHLLKLVGNIGKEILICFGPYMKKNYKRTLYLVDIATSTASLASDILKKRKEKAALRAKNV